VVRLVNLPPDFEALDADAQAVFKLCLGHQFVVRAYGSYGLLELDVSAVADDPTDSICNTVWVEPECVVEV
jgi:hypothetical protein